MKLTTDEQNRALARAVLKLYGRPLKEVATDPKQMEEMRAWYFDEHNPLGYWNQIKRRQPRDPEVAIDNESEIPTQ